MIPSLTDIIQKSIEVIPERLYFYPNKFQPKNNLYGAKIVNYDKRYAYKPINKDFGPIDIG